MTRKRSYRRGYVLVLTLGLLALAAISLASFARFSLGLAAATSSEAEELQRRWCLASARHFFTEQAAWILDAQIPTDEFDTPPWPKPGRAAVTFRLGKHEFSVVVSDEDAKVNLNAVFAHTPDRLMPVIRQAEGGTSALIVRPLPQKADARPFSSWGQVFDLAHVRGERHFATELIGATHEITCWGSRRLNLRRASDEAIRAIAGLTLAAKDVGELIELRKHWSGGDAKELLAQLDLRRPQLSAASRLFTNESSNYSVWIEIDNGQRTWSYQYVDDGGPVCFAW
jgi:hypothetical protein